MRNTKTWMAGLAAVLLLFTGAVFAKGYSVQMVSKGFEFQPAYLHVQPGDTVTFVGAPTHDSVSFYVPKGAKPWHGKLGQTVKVTLTKPGVYIYDCSIHYMLGMIGIVQVGDKVPDEVAVKAAATKLEGQMVENKGRMKTLLADVKW